MATASTIREQKGQEGAKKAVVAGMIGNFVEQYEYGVYGASAAIIARLFFPSGNPELALAATLAIFAISFLVRPIGGLVFGMFGDKLGRRDVLAVTILMMSVATFAIGALPTYATIGFAAPILLLILRIVQGFAIGGEYAGAVSFVVEYAPERRRGLWVSFVSVSVWFGLAVGVGLAFLLSFVLPEDVVLSWGWRVPFLAALPIGLVGLYIRLRIEDTPEFRAFTEEEEHTDATPIRDALRYYWKPILIFISFAITNAVASYTFVTYLPTYLEQEVGLPRSQALLSNALPMLLLTAVLPFAGMLSDRIGRKPMLLTACGLFVILTLPAFIVVNLGGILYAILGQSLYLVSVFFITATLTVSMPEMFPTEVRYSASAIAFNVSFGIFGGFAPLIADGFVTATGNPLAVGFFLMGVAVVSFIVVLLAFRDPYRTPLAEVGKMYR